MNTATRPYATPPPLPTERRSEPRTSCSLGVTLELGGRLCEAVARDVSVSGAFVECPRPMAEGQRLRLRFPVVGVPPAIGAEVRWVLRDPMGDVVGAGVRFDAMRARDMLAWVRFVAAL